MPRKGVHVLHAHVCRWGRNAMQRKVGNICEGTQDECPGGIESLKQNQGRCGLS